jgi:hypothetical protein
MCIFTYLHIQQSTVVFYVKITKQLAVVFQMHAKITEVSYS